MRQHAWPQPLPCTGRGARDPAANPLQKRVRVTLRAVLPKFHALSREIYLDALGDVHDDGRVNSRQSECEFVDDVTQRNSGILFSSVHLSTWWQHQVTDSGLHTQAPAASVSPAQQICAEGAIYRDSSSRLYVNRPAPRRIPPLFGKDGRSGRRWCWAGWGSRTRSRTRYLCTSYDRRERS